MYESKLKKYNKLFLICLVIYYICLSAVFVSGGFLKYIAKACVTVI